MKKNDTTNTPFLQKLISQSKASQTYQ